MKKKNNTNLLGAMLILVAIFNCVCAFAIWKMPELKNEALAGMAVFTGFAVMVVFAGLHSDAKEEEQMRKKLAEERKANSLTEEDIAEIKRAVGGFSKHLLQFVGCILIVVSVGCAISSFCGWFISSFGMAAFILLLIFIFR